MKGALVSGAAVAAVALLLACDDESVIAQSNAGGTGGSGGSGATGGALGSGGSGGSGATGGSGGSAGAPEPAVEHAGGTPRSAIISGNYAYAAIGPRIVVWDVSDPAAPQRIGESEPLAGLVTSIAVKGDVAFVAESRTTGLHGDVYIYDLSNPTAPLQGSVLHYFAQSSAKQPEALLVDGDTLYIADRESGVYTIDVSQPTAPLPGIFIDAPGPSALEVDGGRLFVTYAGFIGFTVASFDVSTPGEVTLLTEWSLPSILSGLDVTIANDRAFVMDVAGLYVYDLLQGAEAQELLFDDQVKSRTLTRAGDTVYVPAEDGLHVYDATATPVAGEKALDVATNRTVVSTVSNGTLLTMGEDAFGNVFDVSTAGAYSHEARFDLPAATAGNSVVNANGLLYIADYNTGLRIVDELTLETVGRVEHRDDTPEFGMIAALEDIAVAGDYAYIADWFNALVVVDVSNPASPEVVGKIDLPDEYPSAVAVAENRVYLAESTNTSFLHVFDATDPRAPVKRGSLPVSHAWSLATKGTLVFVADQSSADGDTSGLLIVDAADAAAPVLLGQYNQDCDSATGVSIDGDVAAVACNRALHLVDISDPAAPTRLSRHVLPVGDVTAVALSEGKAYVGDVEGISLVDVSDPAQPKNVRRVGLPMPGRHITLSEAGRVVVPAGLAGVYNLLLDH
jgi:hypothetical protein